MPRSDASITRIAERVHPKAVTFSYNHISYKLPSLHQPHNQLHLLSVSTNNIVPAIAFNFGIVTSQNEKITLLNKTNMRVIIPHISLHYTSHSQKRSRPTVFLITQVRPGGSRSPWGIQSSPSFAIVAFHQNLAPVRNIISHIFKSHNSTANLRASEGHLTPCVSSSDEKYKKRDKQTRNRP
jgi:hypothetical protein